MLMTRFYPLGYLKSADPWLNNYDLPWPIIALIALRKRCYPQIACVVLLKCKLTANTLKTLGQVKNNEQ